MDLKKVNDTLNQYIRPQTFPIALKLCKAEDTLPERVRIPTRDMGHPITLCQATGLTRRYGWTMALAKEDQCCSGGAQAMGFVSGGEADSIDHEKNFEPGQYKYHLTASLERADFEPDVIVVYVNSAQAMRLAQSAGAGNVNAIATGFGDCGDLAARTVLSNTCQSILPSGGDRVFGSTQDHEYIFAMPRDKVETVMQGLENTHRAGFRYPVVADIRHEPNL
ncbi:MAG: DUF169 domain-containing protein, partial [Deltaproteobacteria bacterium]|nr:DUF169 domain-containing protein [Deltaproteobacteria bacterium]